MRYTFGEFVHKKRMAKGVSLRRFALDIGISSVYLSNIENGIRPAPNGEVIKNIAAALHLNSRDKGKLFDLAAESKSGLTTPYDIACYVDGNKAARAAIRAAEESGISDEKWMEFIYSIS